MQKLADTIAIPADPNDPEDFDITEEALEQALIERRERMRMRGAQAAPTKQQVTLRLDRDVLAKFRETGPGWQARINAVLRAAQV
ncbi:MULTISPECIES: BrnA antitoxin family protein [Sphingomonas]|uniref:BrnA antitoxin family protein n=1 Tax=Sphingomonas kyungheensis TaxID=1069987 RepID=A0ABU8GYQ1_9SPHN|nr:BrnA antitoxin family protein [Sphingomonas sp. CV7422]